MAEENTQEKNIHNNNNKNKKILFCASAVSHILHFHNVYFEYLKKMGFEIHVAAGINSGGNCDIDLLNAEKTFTLAFEKGKKFFKNIYTVFALRKIIRREKYDIVSTHSMLAGFTGRLAVMLSRRKNIKIIHTCHGYLFNDDKSFRSKLMIILEKFLALRTDILFVMNSDDYNIAKKHKLCKSIEYTNGMGINPEKLNASGCFDFEKYNIPKDKKYFLCVGEFSKRKNQQNIICAFNRFLRGLSDDLRNSYHLIFLGGGALLDECKRLCENLEIARNTTFCGYVGDTAAFYKLPANCVVSASRFEGMPFNILEAFHFGVPVIASNVKGHKDLVVDKVNGHLYEYNDETRLAELFGKVSEISNISEIKNIRLDEKYYFDSVKEKILNCYGKILP